MSGASDRELYALIINEMKRMPGDAVVNLHIRVSGDYRSYSVEGDVVRFIDPAPSIPLSIIKSDTTLSDRPHHAGVPRFDPNTGMRLPD